MKYRLLLSEEQEQLDRWHDYVKSSPMLAAAVKVLDKLSKKGYIAYITGGTVRDIILGKDPHDVDIATNMPISEIMKIYKTYDIGKSKDFGIVVVREGGHSFEVANFREDGEYKDGRRPESVKIVMSFEGDASRRDFTINAMAVDKDGNIIDYFDGRKDIKNKVIKTVGNPKDRFREDHLRMMRVARFSSKLGFDVDPNTKQAAKELSVNITKIAPERIKDEIFKAAAETGDKFARYLAELDDMDILDIILPEITKLKGMEHREHDHPEGDAWEHTLAALRVNKIADPLINLSILLHDVGKGITGAMSDKGYIQYLGHAEAGIDLVNNISDRLRMSNSERETLIYAVGNHMKFHTLLGMKPSKVAKLVNDDNWDVLVAVARADEFARGTKFMTTADFEKIVDMAIEIKEKYGMKGVSQTMKLVDGNHVMAVTGLKPGKQVGDIIKQTTAWIIDNGIESQEEIDKYITAQV